MTWNRETRVREARVRTRVENLKGSIGEINERSVEAGRSSIRLDQHGGIKRE